MTWTLVITCAACGLVLCAIAGFAKACMDTIVFRRTGFSGWPANLRAWMLEMRSDSAKWRDGWHVCQMLWHAAYGLGFFCFGLAALSAAMILRAPLWWALPAGMAGAWVLRLVGHYFGFSRTYPVK